MLKVKVRILGGPTSDKGEEEGAKRLNTPLCQVDLYVQRKCLLKQLNAVIFMLVSNSGATS